MKICLICSSEFTPTKRQYYCNKCRETGQARKAVLRKYNSSIKNRANQSRWYYKDILRTKSSKNRYNRSVKGKISKIKWYSKNKEKVIKKQLTVYRKQTIARTHAHDKMARKFPDKVCSSCDSIMNIHVHHKDKNVFNNELSNLIYLCSGCHGIAHEQLNNQVLFR